MRKESLREDTPQMIPVHFVELSFHCPYFSPDLAIEKVVGKKYLLPNTSSLCLEERFADVYMGWNEQALIIAAAFHWPLSRSFWPQIAQGDALEVFINTRAASAPVYTNRFCHHFYALPQKVEEHQAGELTKFRTDDAHPLCDETQLYVDCQKIARHHLLFLRVPSSCLYGYDPRQFDQMGFTYRLSRYGADPQNFAASTRDFAYEQQPQLWSLARLTG